MIEVTIWAAVFAGLLSFVSPCVLSMVPTYLAAMSGNKTRRSMLFNALTFVFGFSIIFVALGALAGFFSFYAIREFSWIMQAAGFIVVVFGLQMILVSLDVGWAKKAFSFLYREKRLQVKKGRNSPVRFGLLGMAFGFGWTPCIGPILGGILALAYSEQTATRGAFLLFFYSMGLGIPFLLSAFFAGSITNKIRKIGGLYKIIEIVSGLMLITLGILIATDNLVLLNAWFYKLVS
ncbi:MAG: cytochrome c biogenesis protein CcdA [Candidatus Spechtbacterales bacterium]